MPPVSRDGTYAACRALRSKNKALQTAARTESGLKGFDRMDAGSGRLAEALKYCSGWAVMNTTGLLAVVRISLTASSSRGAVFELNVRHDQLRLALGRKGDRLPAGARHPDYFVSEVLDDGLEVHCDDRLVLDDENPGGEATGDVARPALQERAHPQRAEAHGRRRLADREAFHGRE